MTHSVIRAMGLLSTVEGLFVAGLLPYLIEATGSVATTNAIEAAFWITMSIAELPTAYLQARLGGRKALLFAVTLRALAFMLLYFAGRNSILVTVGMMLAGVAVTFLTGTFSMQVRLAAAKFGWEVDYTRFSSDMSMVRQLGLVCGCLASYFVIRYLGVSSIWIACTLVSLPLFLYVFQTWDHVSGAHVHPPFGHYYASFQAITQLPPLRNAILLDATLIILTYAMLYNNAMAFVLAVAGTTLSEICIRQVILEKLPTDQAAAVSSIQSLLQNVAGAGAFLVLSLALTRADLSRIWLLAGLLLCLISFLAARALIGTKSER